MNWFKSKKEKKQFSKMIAVYLRDEYGKILVAPFFVDESWLYYEQEDVEVLNFDVTDERLGESIKRNLNKFAEKNAISTKHNLTDWPAYKASKLKTVKEFEKKYSRIPVSGLNGAAAVKFREVKMKRYVLVTMLFLVAHVMFGQTNCSVATIEAKSDLENGIYTFHSLEFLPTESTYLFVLREDYNIKWSFTEQDSLSYYDCYDSVMTVFLKKKYGDDFLKKATAKADSLENTDDWRREPEFLGGNIAMFKFINDRLVIEPGDLGERIQTKIFIQFTVTEHGELEGIKVPKGIGDEIDCKVVQIFKEMPNWKPAYLYGNRYDSNTYIRLILNLNRKIFYSTSLPARHI